MANRVRPAPAAPAHGVHASLHAAERASDLTRLGLAAGLLVLTLVAIQRHHLSVLERDVFRLVNDLPHALMPPLWVVMQLGARLAPFVIGLVVIVGLRRLRLGLSIIAAGTGAWLVAQLMKSLVERPRPADFLDDLPRAWSSGGPGFVSGHTAVATAIAAAVAPNLPRPWRRVVWGLAALVGFARIYSGVHLPLDVVGGACIGWFVGTLVHLLVGTTGPLHTPGLVADQLHRLGLDVATVEPADVFAKVSVPYRVTTTDGRRLFAKELDPNPRRTDWVLRIARVFATRERRDISALASLPVAADHEAAVTMAAHSAGVRVPDVVLARGNGASAVVVLEEIPGSDLTTVPAWSLSDAVLRDVWQQVALLRRARIAHRDLVRGNVLLDPDGHSWIVDFRDGEVGARDAALDNDVAELIASLAVVVGAERAVASAGAVLGHEAVDRALPALEPFALSPRTRAELVSQPALLNAVRAAAGGGPEASADLRIAQRLWLPALVSAGGYAVMITVAGWSEVATALSTAGLRWVGVAGVVYAAAPLLAGYALVLAARRRVAVGRSAAGFAVASTAETLGGPPARREHLRRYLRSCGARGEDPTRAVDLVLAAELTAGILVLAAAATLGWLRDTLEVAVTTPALVYTAIAAVATAAGWVLRRRTDRDPHGSIRDSMAAVVRATRHSPDRTLAVLSAMTAAELALVLSLVAAVRAMAPGPPFVEVAIVLAANRVLLALLRISGTPVVGEAICTAALCAFGVPPAHAVLALLTYALYRNWITAAVSAVAGPRLAPVYVPDPAGRAPVRPGAGSPPR